MAVGDARKRCRAAKVGRVTRNVLSSCLLLAIHDVAAGAGVAAVDCASPVCASKQLERLSIPIAAWFEVTSAECSV